MMIKEEIPAMPTLPQPASRTAPSGYGCTAALAVALTLALALSGVEQGWAQTPDLGALAAAVKANPEIAAGNTATALPGGASGRDIAVPDVTETDVTETDMTGTAPAGSRVVLPPGGVSAVWTFPASPDELAAEAKAAQARIETVAVPDTRTVICSFLAGLATPEANRPAICDPERKGG